jgi:hypothetical protein
MPYLTDLSMFLFGLAAVLRAAASIISAFKRMDARK